MAQTAFVNVTIYYLHTYHQEAIGDYFCPGGRLFDQDDVGDYNDRNTCDDYMPPTLGGFGALCGGLLVLYISKYWFPLNYICLLAFSLLQAALFLGFDEVRIEHAHATHMREQRERRCEQRAAPFESLERRL